jgi:hypothetical protein
MSSKTANPSCTALPGASHCGLPWHLPAAHCWSSSSCISLSPTTFSGAAMRGCRARWRCWAMSPSRRPRTLFTTALSEKWPSWQAKKCPTGIHRRHFKRLRLFLQTSASGSPMLWVGAGSGEENLKAIHSGRIVPDLPTDLRVRGFGVPFRVASTRIDDGSSIYLGLSERDELRVLRNLAAALLPACGCCLFFSASALSSIPPIVC